MKIVIAPVITLNHIGKEYSPLGAGFFVCLGFSSLVETDFSFH